MLLSFTDSYPFEQNPATVFDSTANTVNKIIIKISDKYEHTYS